MKYKVTNQKFYSVYSKIKAHYVAELTVQFIITASASNEGSDEHVHARNLEWVFADFKLTVYDRKNGLVLLHANNQGADKPVHLRSLISAFIIALALSTPATWKVQASRESL